MARRYTDDRHEAEDIAQEALLRAWRHQPSLREQQRWQPWLTTIVRNEAFRRLARYQPELVEEPMESWGSEDEAVLGTEERVDVQAALNALTSQDQTLLMLRYDEDLTQSAIADRLGMPEGTVKVRLHRARAKLQEVFGER